MSPEEVAALLRLLARQAALIDRQHAEIVALRAHVVASDDEPVPPST